MTFPTIGLIGYGGIGRVHGMAYRSLPFHYGLPADAVRIGGVATTRPESARAAAAELGCGFWTADYHELLARPEIEAVDICVPNHLHAAIVVAAAAAGQTEAVRQLLAQGADVNQTDAQGRTALMLAAARGDDTLVQRLLAAGADPGITDRQGWNAAKHARQAGHSDLAHRLGQRLPAHEDR